MDPPSAGAKSPKPKKGKKKRAKHKDRDKEAQDGMESHFGAADCAPSTTCEMDMVSGPSTPAPEASSPACYQRGQLEPQSSTSKAPERWVTPTSANTETPAVCGRSQDKPPSSTPAAEVFLSPRSSPAVESARQQHCEQLGPDQLGGKEHTQLKEEGLGPSGNIPGTSDATGGEKKTVQPQGGDVKPPKHHEKVKRSKHSKKPGRSTENRSSPDKETKGEALVAVTSRDRNAPEEKDAPAGTLEEGRGSSIQHRPPKVPSSQEQTKPAEAVVKGSATVDAVVAGPDQQQGAGTNPSDKLPAADREATKSSVIEEPIYYDSFRTITNQQGDPLAEDVIGGFTSKADSTLLAFPTYLIEPDKSPRISTPRVSRNCTVS